MLSKLSSSNTGICIMPQRANQDEGAVVENKNGNTRGVVFDGHGQADNIVAVKAMRIFNEEVETPIREIVPKIVAATKFYHTSGSTMAFFEIQGDEVEIALLGDSRVVVYRPGVGAIFQEECIGLSDKAERDRVNALGSKTEIKQEVWRMSVDYEVGLPMSRAFGNGRLFSHATRALLLQS
jgi:serine/threonine protein phosphatase PrpC